MLIEVIQVIFSKLYGFIIPRADTIYYTEKIKAVRVKWDEAAERKEVLHLTVREYVLYAYCLVMALRYQMSGYVLSYGDGSQSSYFKLDVVMDCIREKSHFDKYAFLLSSLLLIYAIALHYQRNFCTNETIISQEYKIINQTLINYWNNTSNSRYRIDFTNRNLIQVLLQINGNIRQINKQNKIFHSSINYNKLDPTNRQRKLVALILKTERFNIVFFVLLKLLVVATAVGYLKFALKHRRHYSLYQYLFIVFDRIATMSVGSKVILNQFTGIYILLIFTRVYGNEYRLLFKDLALLLKQLKFKRLIPFKVVNLIDLANIRGRHTILSRFINIYDKTIVSRELYIFAIFNISFNIYITTRIIFGKPPQIMVLAMTIFQVGATVVSAIPMIRTNKLIHQPAKYLPSVQEKYSGYSVTREKLKLQTFYEQVCILDPASTIGLSIGPLGKLTRFAAVKFVIFYICYSIFSCSIVNKV